MINNATKDTYQLALARLKESYKLLEETRTMLEAELEDNYDYAEEETAEDIADQIYLDLEELDDMLHYSKEALDSSISL